MIIQDHVLRHVTGHVGSGNMKINEFADIDPTKENDLGFVFSTEMPDSGDDEDEGILEDDIDVDDI